MLCPSCGTENREGRKFCAECGSALAPACPVCGAANEPGERFCGECGTALTGAPVAAVREAPAAERRLVSVLFADLVGFTPLSETRDAEEVRELLSRYFESCRRLIQLYGGTVEKFIGDAVMAVWGTPTATEDDAERAVRAALDLVVAVSALGDELGAAELRARAAVLTGEAAVTISGIAGIGKSRLSWEFFKYLDGVAQTTYYHRGRCLSYGEGVTYWALADMVRMRARIAEDEQRGSALPKLQGVVAEHLHDEEERQFVEPRLAHLLGLEESSGYEREGLFAAWRLF